MRACWIFVAPVLVMAGGCAGLLNKGRQDMVLESSPSGAQVVLNGRELCVTPCAYSYHPDDGRDLQVEFQLAGHDPARFDVRPKESGGVLFLEAMLFHIPYIVDHQSPSLYRMPVDRIRADLYRTERPQQTRHLVPITGLRSALGQQPDLGTLDGRVAKMDKAGPYGDLLDPDQLTGAVQSGLRETWVEARPARLGSTKGDELVQQAKLHLRPEIISINGVLAKKSNRINGPVEMTMNWQFFSASKTDSLLFSLPMTTTYHANHLMPGDLVHKAMAHAARKLAEDNELPVRLAEHYNAGLARSKGGEVVLAKPAPIKFQGRKDMLTALVKAVGTVQAGGGHGSGFLITNDGYMITNEHVVGREPVVKVRFEQGFTLDAQVLKVNKDFDLALLKVPATDLPALTFGNDKALMLGEELFAIGTPVDAALGQSVTRGILSGHREREGRTYIQTDVSINPGNSGGPLIDEAGHVVGVTTMKLSGRGVEGLGFAVPISVALEMLNLRWEP